MFVLRFIRINLLNSSLPKNLQTPKECISTLCQRFSKLKPNYQDSYSSVFNSLEPQVLNNLKECQFLTPNKTLNTTLGLLGIEVINNCKSEWTRHIMKNYNATVETRNISKLDNSGTNDHIIPSLILQKLLKFYEENTEVPQAVAFNFLHQSKANKSYEFNIDEMVLGIFTKKNSESDLESVHANSLKWLKKYLRKPAMLINGGEKSPDNENNHETGLYKHYDTSFNIFQSSIIKSNALEDLQEWNDAKRLFDHVPDILLIKICVNQLLACIFADSHHIVKFDDYHHEMMCIHHFLAPIKVAVQINNSSHSDIEELRQLADELCLHTRNMGLTCWNAHQMNLTNDQLDSSGVPYILIVSSQTLDNGLMHIRNRDTSLEMEMHITHLNKKLFLYLQPR